MKPSELQLYERLKSFRLDESDAALPFSVRLARENGWSLDYTHRVIDEYRRFLLLAMTGERPATPSDQVDQAWHLHLTDTESYWNDLCAKVLERPLHHGPTKGGPEETAHLRELYEATITRYREVFEQEPPADIWPDAPIRFGRDLAFQRVNLAQHWIIPKPCFHRSRFKPGQLPRSAVLVSGILPVAITFSNPFDLPGSDFLVFFAALLLLSVIAVALRFTFEDATEPSGDLQRTTLDVYELAYLTGGSRRVVEAATAALVRCHALKITAHRKCTRLVPGLPLPDTAHPVEKIIRASICAAEGAPQSRRFRKFAMASIVKIDTVLTRRGLIKARKTFWLARTWAVVAMSPVLLVGGLKLVVGIERHKPIGFLALGLVITVAMLGWLVFCYPRATPAGLRLLREIRDAHKQGRPSPRLAKCDGLDNELVLRVGLLGLIATVGATDPITQVLAPHNRHSEAASGFGGGDGGGGAGGCGGGCSGGCGGCGGCGG